MHSEIQDLHAAVAAHIQTISGGLPRIKYVSAPDFSPSLVIAYELYEDPDRAADVVKRNNIKHPSFVPPDPPLEVLGF